MAGTKTGGAKAAATNRKKYGDNFYAEIGAKGGRNGHTGGFASNPELAKIAGAKGGKASKRGPAINPRKKNQSAGLTPGSRQK
jgi:general stress protein YciG